MMTFRMFGLAVSVTLVAIAVAGAASARAGSTVLCSTEACGTHVTHLHARTPTGNKAVILTNVLNVECDLLYLGGVGPLGSPQVIEGNFTYTNCTNGCEVTEESGTSTFELLRIGHETAELTLWGEMHVRCGFFINCSYASEGMKGIAKGALLPFTGEEELFEQDELERISGFCPESTKLDFLVLSLSAVYIGS